MLTCIACSKQLVDADEDTTRGTPSTKDAVKSLTSQIKDMVLKFSGVYRQCKPGSGSSSKGQQLGSYASSEYDDGGPVRDARSGRWKHQPYKGAWEPTRFGVAGGGSRTDGFKLSQYEVWTHGEGNRRGEAVEEVFEDEPKEWVAQVEPGVHITFLALPQGGNDLKRIRFSREMFNKWQAQRWWGENYDKIMELYNVQRFNRQALPTPPRSEDERSSPYSGVGSTRESPLVTPPWRKDPLPSPTTTTAANSRAPTATSTTAEPGKLMMFPKPPDDTTANPISPHTRATSIASSAGGGGGDDGGNGVRAAIAAMAKVEAAASADASRTTSSQDEASVSASNASDGEEWVEQDEPGVYITIRQLPDGTRELRRVRFSRERFGEVHAKLWWEENRERIHAQYL